MMFVFMFSLLNPVLLALFCRRLLNNKKTWLIIVCIYTILGLTGVFIALYGKSITDNNFYISLIIPACSIIIYRVLLMVFKYKFERLPLDTAIDRQSGLFWDKAFNVIFVLIGIFGPMVGALILSGILK